MRRPIFAVLPCRTITLGSKLRRGAQTMNRLNVTLLASFFLTGSLHAAVRAQSPPGQEHPMMPGHHAGMNQPGDQVMGFSREKTTHHFRLYPDGGAIEVQANDPHDTASRDQIRMHLAHIAQMFGAGDFNAPMLIHDRVPPGVPTLKRLKSSVRYAFQETDQGGRVRITTHNAQALQAVHDFLRFQITDHQTGDSLRASPPTEAPVQ